MWEYPLAIVVVLAVPALAQYEITRSTVDGGGVMNSTGGSFELSGTIGQPDAGPVMIGDDLELIGGFWFAQAPGDCNTDGVVNLWDHDSFVVCLNVSGPGGTASPECTCFDLNSDGTVDLLDFAMFQSAFSGSSLGVGLSSTRVSGTTCTAERELGPRGGGYMFSTCGDGHAAHVGRHQPEHCRRGAMVW